MSTAAFQNPQAMFYHQYQAVRRDEIVGVLLALFFGTFGIHHFYLHRTGLGVLYCCFFWSGIPALLGVIECFLMPGRVREYNAIQAAAIAAHLGIAVPGWGQNVGPAFIAPPPPQYVAAPLVAPAACSQCQAVNPPGARFCSACGNPLG